MVMRALKIDSFRYDAMIGVGGVGSGAFFKLMGNHTLGREESRSGFFLDQNDHCKLHIISHYVQTLLGRDFSAIPVGKVGNDDVGVGLLEEMQNAGIHTDYMEKSGMDRTLFSFCFLYPDGSGGNMTTSDSACSKVDAMYVEKAIPEFIRFKGKGIALAVPEAPMDSREKLLEIGTTYDFYRVASFTTEEIPGVVNSDLLAQIDLLALNLDEAAAATGLSVENYDSLAIVEAAIKKLTGVNPGIQISITHGNEGSWTWEKNILNHVSIVDVATVNTAGAGDAYLSGLIAGLVAGLSYKDAQELGSLTGSHSVTASHTINKNTNRHSLNLMAGSSTNLFSKEVIKLLEE